MSGSAGNDKPLKVKAALIDPAAMRVAWLNESAAAGLGVEPGAPSQEVPIESVVPAAVGQTPAEALAQVAVTGRPLRLRADMLANRLGSVAMLTSIERLPDGMLLVLTESSFVSERSPGSGRSARDRRR